MKKESFNLKTTISYLLIFSIGIFSNPVFAHATLEDLPSIFDELNFQEMIEVNLETDMSKLLDNRLDGEKYPAIFSYTDQEGKAKEWNIKVRLRGKFRRMKCEKMPPLKLNFNKKDLSQAGLAKFDDLKLVTHCLENKKDAKLLLVKEYLGYKIYNQITPQSYRVQFVKINYKDTSSGMIDSQYGILIEDTAQLGARLEAEKKEEAYGYPRDYFNVSQVKVVSLFNYMIGNSDWSISGMRNVKVFLKNGKHILVPYDFDFAGIVDAPYVALKAEHGIKSSKERVYLGFKEDSQDLKSVMRIFNKKRGSIIKMIKDSELLSKRDKREVVKYINSFYEESNYINLPLR